MNDCSNEVFDLETLATHLKRRWYKASVVESLEQASELIHTIVSETTPQSVSFGGSVTIEKSGLVESLKKVKDLHVMDTYDKSNGIEALLAIRREALLSDLFITSANAITKDSRIFLLDGLGNRTAAVQFGPNKVILVIGKNKIAEGTHEAMARVKDIASVANNKRLGRSNPCIKAGKCMDCKSSERICSYWCILDRSGIKERIHVILVNEDLGF